MTGGQAVPSRGELTCPGGGDDLGLAARSVPLGGVGRHRDRVGGLRLQPPDDGLLQTRSKKHPPQDTVSREPRDTERERRRLGFVRADPSHTQALNPA